MQCHKGFDHCSTLFCYVVVVVVWDSSLLHYLWRVGLSVNRMNNIPPVVSTKAVSSQNPRRNKTGGALVSSYHGDFGSMDSNWIPPAPCTTWPLPLISFQDKIRVIWRLKDSWTKRCICRNMCSLQLYLGILSPKAPALRLWPVECTSLCRHSCGRDGMPSWIQQAWWGRCL